MAKKKEVETKSTFKAILVVGVAFVGLAGIIYLQFNTWQAILLIGGILIVVGALGSALMWRQR